MRISPRFVTVMLAAAASVGNAAIGDVVTTVRRHRQVTAAGATSEKRAQSVLSEDKAIEIAVAAVREAKRFSGAECDIRIRKHGDGWVVLFVFLPAGPGLDVLVKVSPDGSHQILPTY
jgi:hypothetical protein